MPRQNRAYKKGASHRDCRKFIIVAEGVREDEYFRYFNKLTPRVEVNIVLREEGKSAAKHLLDRVRKHDSKYGIEPSDFVWFVLDVDKWPRKEIDSIFQNCTTAHNWNISISNPCFEIWLHYHLLKEIPEGLETAARLKANLNNLVPGGYKKTEFTKMIKVAIENSRECDKHKSHYFPESKTTKVYLLADQLLAFLGNNWLN
ncbi:RloB family protein [Chitinophaga sancti]|uniref:RloB family protein n=1 Tax=Chitinophaga sancti TaxID=1004 RepID=UPI003F79109D